MKDVQGWWEVPSICYYCSLLGNAFGLPDFTIEVIFLIKMIRSLRFFRHSEHIHLNNGDAILALLTLSYLTEPYLNYLFMPWTVKVMPSLRYHAIVVICCKTLGVDNWWETRRNIYEHKHLSDRKKSSVNQSTQNTYCYRPMNCTWSIFICRLFNARFSHCRWYHNYVVKLFVTFSSVVRCRELMAFKSFEIAANFRLVSIFSTKQCISSYTLPLSNSKLKNIEYRSLN